MLTGRIYPAFLSIALISFVLALPPPPLCSAASPPSRPAAFLKTRAAGSPRANAAPGATFAAATIGDTTTFVDLNAGLGGAWAGAGTWFDYDNDGDLDVLVAGWNDTTYFTRIYANNEGVFTDIHAALHALGAERGIAVGDYDNDGDLDFAIAGRADTLDSQYESIIYRNDHGTFTDIHAALLPLVGSVTWVDLTMTATSTSSSAALPTPV